MLNDKVLKRKYNTDSDSSYNIDSSSESEFFPENIEIPTKKKRKKRTPKKIKKKITVTFTSPIENLLELIQLSEKYSSFKEYEYECNIDLKKLHNILKELKLLNNLIGLTTFKDSLVKQLVIMLMNIQPNDEKDMKHIILYGNPGVGKTTIAKLLGKIYSKIGILSSENFIIGKRTDFVAEYLGQTEHKTRNFLRSCKGGVLFIDEIYSLGTMDKEDMYSITCINELNRFLSEESDDFICIVAGYKNEIINSFLSVNAGLERRFPYQYTIDNYNSEELMEIFLKFVKDSSWELVDNSLNIKYFTDQIIFRNQAGAVRTFFEKCKECHCVRALMIPKEMWKKINEEDIKKGYELFKLSSQIEDMENLSYKHIYM